MDSVPAWPMLEVQVSKGERMQMEKLHAQTELAGRKGKSLNPHFTSKLQQRPA